MAGAPQKIYDDPEFCAGYRALRANDTGLNGAIEVPALLRAWLARRRRGRHWKKSCGACRSLS